MIWLIFEVENSIQFEIEISGILVNKINGLKKKVSCKLYKNTSRKMNEKTVIEYDWDSPLVFQ